MATWPILPSHFGLFQRRVKFYADFCLKDWVPEPILKTIFSVKFNSTLEFDQSEKPQLVTWLTWVRQFQRNVKIYAEKSFIRSAPGHFEPIIWAVLTFSMPQLITFSLDGPSLGLDWFQAFDEKSCGEISQRQFTYLTYFCVSIRYILRIVGVGRRRRSSASDLGREIPFEKNYFFLRYNRSKTILFFHFFCKTLIDFSESEVGILFQSCKKYFNDAVRNCLYFCITLVAREGFTAKLWVWFFCKGWLWHMVFV